MASRRQPTVRQNAPGDLIAGDAHAGRGIGSALRAGPDAITALQRSAGNAAVSALVAAHLPRRGASAVGGVAGPGAVGGRTSGGLAVQRHASFEHTLLGNTSADALSEAAVSREQRGHLLKQLADQANFFLNDPGADPRNRFPDVRWVQLHTSGLWLSYGELTSMADYLPSRLDDLGRDVVEPVLQRMRRLSAAQWLKMHGMYGENEFKGEAESGGWEFLQSVGIEKAMDKATAGLGADRYFAMVARNACHFAPDSWHRWARFHEEATDHALAYFRGKGEKVPVASVDDSQDEHLRQAWVANGYGDHFLQDSFAAGHLINKTLVMQWFVDYVNKLSSKWWDLLGRMWWGDDTKPWYGMPGEDVLANMGASRQPGMAGRELYRPPTESGTTSMDRSLGDTTTDPQSAQERESHEGRVAGSGVVAAPGRTREQNYQAYLKFLNSSFLQMAAGETHDYFNARGLTVVNDRGDRMRVGGDNTLLTESGGLGARVAAEAAELSRQAIEELTKMGETDKTVGRIAELWPTKVWVGGEDGQALPLSDWHDEVLRGLCEKEIFPGVVDSFNSKVARAGQSELVAGGVGEPESRPPIPSELGDFVTPGGDPAG